MTKYRMAPEVQKIAEDLIDTVDEHAPLADVRVEYVFLEKAPISGGRVMLGRARRLTGLAAVIANPGRHSGGRCVDPDALFVIEISEDTWGRLDDDRRRALVDHELMHCRVGVDDDGDPVLKMRPHDFEEFAAIIRRHGLWTASAQGAGAAVIEQLVLALDEHSRFIDTLGRVDPPTGEIRDADPPADDDA